MIIIIESLSSLLVEVAGVGRALNLGRDGRREGARGEALPVKTLKQGNMKKEWISCSLCDSKYTVDMFSIVNICRSY